VSCLEKTETIQEVQHEFLDEACEQTRAGFSAYLDGALDGNTMAQLAAHMRECTGCHAEFIAWRSMQDALGTLGPAPVPAELQARLRDALATEIVTGRYLSPYRRFVAFCQRTLAPAGLRLGAGFAATLVILGSAAWFLSAAIPVQANDDRMAHLNAPKFLYSQTSPEPITTGREFVAVIVDAKIDARGRVYDFNVVDGPNDPSTRLKIESNLLGSVFRPATVFGEPVPGHAMMTFTSVSARS
jgi:hypothetical protein